MFLLVDTSHQNSGENTDKTMKDKRDSNNGGSAAPVNSTIGLVMAGLGVACLGHAGIWFVLRDPSSASSSFVGAEGLAVWSLIFIVLGLYFWRSERRNQP